MSTTIDTSLCSAILTRELIDMIDQDDPECHPKIKEEQMVAIASLLANIVFNTCSAFSKNEMDKFDANPGDGNCLLQGVLLHDLMTDSSIFKLREEASQLHQKCFEIRQAIAKRSNKQITTPKEFFHQQFDGIALSEQMVTLAKLFLHTHTKVHSRFKENGWEETKTELGRLDSLSHKKHNIYKIDKNVREGFLAKNAIDLSNCLINYIQNVGTRFVEENSLAARMLRVIKETKPPTEKDPRFTPKKHSCLMFQMEAALMNLRERRGIIDIKTIDRTQPKRHFFFEASQEGFTHIEKSDVLGESDPIVVIESHVPDPDEFVDFIQANGGLEQQLLAATAMAPPYCQTSTIDEVEDLDAKRHIEDYRREANLEKFMITHVYANVFKREEVVK